MPAASRNNPSPFSPRPHHLAAATPVAALQLDAALPVTLRAVSALCDPHRHGALLVGDLTLARIFAAELRARGVDVTVVAVASPCDDVFPIGELAALLGVRVPSRRLAQLLEQTTAPVAFSRLCAVAASLHSARFSAAAFDLLLPSSWGVAHHERSRAWRRVVAHLDDHDHIGARSLAAARTEGWNGADLSALAVLEAVVRLASSDGLLDIAGDLLAAVAGMSPATCRRALHRLVTRGYLVRCPPRRGVCCLRLIDRGGTQVVSPPWAGSVTDLSADQARSVGVSRAQLRVWREIARPASVNSLALRLGLSWRTVRKHLDALEKAGWVRRDSSGWVAVSDPPIGEYSRVGRDLRRVLDARSVRRVVRRQWRETLTG